MAFEEQLRGRPKTPVLVLVKIKYVIARESSYYVCVIRPLMIALEIEYREREEGQKTMTLKSSSEMCWYDECL